MDIDKASELGMNKTGIKMSPVEAKKTAEGAQKLTVPPEGDGVQALRDLRIDYLKDSRAVGTVPMPATPKGMFSALMERFKKGDHAFLDKLGERIAFERTGVRLFEGLITKYVGSEDKTKYPDLAVIKQFQEEELKHFRWCCEAMEEIGGDATAMTPSADVAGMAALGWVQAMNDPRVNFKQCLEIMLQAELVDNDCWDVLIQMAKEVGLDKIAERFQQAKAEEDVHLITIRNWIMDMNLHGEFTDQEQLQQ